MKLIFIVALLFLASTTYAQHDDWSVYMADYDGKPGTTILDMKLKDRAPITRYPYCLRTGPVIKNCTIDGLPADSATIVEMDNILDQIDHRIIGKTSNVKAGTFTFDCSRQNYYYVADTVGLRAEIEQAYKTQFPSETYVIAIKEDAKWETYLQFLYPNDQTQEWIRNGKVVYQFIKGGDDLMTTRLVDYFTYFKTKADCDKFVSDFILPLGYSVVSITKEKNGDRPYRLHISKDDYIELNHITNITFSLRTEAKKYDGEFDGWEAVFVKPK